MTGSAGRFEARAAINTATPSGTYTDNRGKQGGGKQGNNKDIADRNVQKEEKVDVDVL